MPAEEKYVRWFEGAAAARASDGVLELVFSNARIVLEPRRLLLEGVGARQRSRNDGRRLRVLLEASEPLKPITPPPRIDIDYTGVVGGFQVMYTSLGFENYITVVTPGTHLYDYVVVSSTLVYMEASGRRTAFYEGLDGGLAVYLT